MPPAYMQYSSVGLLSSTRKENLKTREYENGEGKLHRNDKNDIIS